MRYYIIPGVIVGFLVGFLLQFIFSSFFLFELSLHTMLRELLGYPALFTISPISASGTVLRLYFHLIHGILGGFVGLFLFHMRYRNVGYIVGLTEIQKSILLLLTIAFFFFFVRVDLLESFDRLFAPPTVDQSSSLEDANTESDAYSIEETE